MRGLALVLAAALAACAGPRKPLTVKEAREKDAETVTSRADDFDGAAYAGQYVVVQDGDVVAMTSLPDDAVRAAAKKSASPLHRYVFRAGDREPPLYRMAYLAEGGIVVGRRFLADLGLETTFVAGKPTTVRPRGSSSGIDLRTSPRVAFEVTTLDDALHLAIDAVIDPDFDGGLLVPVPVAAALSLERFEIPGDAEIQVAIGRPFRARRATVLARVPSLGVSGPVEVEYENNTPRK